MFTSENLWLRSQAAQQNLLKIVNYNSAFLGTAMVQGVQMGVNAPHAFWAAVGRASAAKAPKAVTPKAAALTPKPVAKPKPALKPVEAAKPKPAAKSAPKPVAKARPAPKAEAAKPKPVGSGKPAAPAKSKATATPEPKPAAAPVAPPKPIGFQPLEAPRGGKADDLVSMLGVGAKLAQSLNGQGVYHFDQIAALDEAAIGKLDAEIKGFRMLTARYDLINQAKTLG